MKIKSSALITLILMLLYAFPVKAQPANTSAQWSAVQSIPVGDKLSIHLKDGKKVEGKLISVTDTTVTIDRKNRPTDYRRDAIARIYRFVANSAGKSVAKSAAIGAGIGFAGGAIVAGAAGSYEDLGTAELVGILGGIGAAIGAGIGALIGSLGSHKKRVLVYQGN
ncbi:MAG: hypothetical protein AB1757_02800 [Acidobacteriota bacterium]